MAIHMEWAYNYTLISLAVVGSIARLIYCFLSLGFSFKMTIVRALTIMGLRIKCAMVIGLGSVIY